MYTNRKNFMLTPSTFSGLMDNMLSNKWDRIFFDDNRSHVTTPVNIKETDKSYQLDVIAPGLKKEDFELRVDGRVVPISFFENIVAGTQRERSARARVINESPLVTHFYLL